LADGRHEAGKDRMLEILTIMSDEDREYPLIRNEDTLRRRAWIDRALAGVRGRLKPAELGEALPAAALAPVEPPAIQPAATEPPEAAGDRGRPKLYLVGSSD
jgi:hypothetical protein